MKLRRTARSWHRAYGVQRVRCARSSLWGRCLQPYIIVRHGDYVAPRARRQRWRPDKSERGGLQEQHTYLRTVTVRKALTWATSEPRAGTGEPRQCGPVLPRPRVVRDSRAALRGAQEAGRQAARVERHDLCVCIHTRALDHVRANSASTLRDMQALKGGGLQAASPGHTPVQTCPGELEHQLDLSSTNLMQSSAPGPASGI